MTIRIAFPEEGLGVTTLSLEELEHILEDRSLHYHYADAEYVEADSPYTTHAEIRRHGYSVRSFIPWRRH